MLFNEKGTRLEMVIEKIHSNKEQAQTQDDEKGQGISLSSSEQASPTSSCQSSLSDVQDADGDGDEYFTMGATATTPYECNICKRAFVRSSLLSKHVQSHTEQLQFSCPYCRRLFKHKRSRDRHTKLHTGDKKYKCLHCDSAFARSDHLKIHMKTHDNKKPHQCELCNRGYNTAAALASHQQHHSKQEHRRCSSSASRSSAISTPSPGNIRTKQSSEAVDKGEQLQSQVPRNPAQTSTPTPQANKSLMDPGFNILQTAIDLPKVSCMYCGKDFLNMTYMYQHIHTEHRAILNNISQSMSYTPLQSPGIEEISPKQMRQISSPTYACDRCTMRFESPLLLQEHTENVHWGSTGVYPYDFNAMASEKVDFASQSKPTDLSRKRRLDNQSDYKRKSDDTLMAKQTSPSTGSPYESNDKPCICSYCYAQMPNFKMFLLHMETHVAINAPVSSLPLGGGNSIIGRCPLCGEPARSALELGRHIFGHAISNVTARCCHCCKKPFDQMDQLQKHLMDSHSQTVYKCCICNDIFDTQLALQVHFSNKHSPECKHYRCNLCCDQVFHDRLTAELHVNMKHSIQAPNVKNYLVSRFSEVDMRVEYPMYQCPFCQKAFKDEYLQYVHILKEHNETREGENYLLETTSAGQRVLSLSPSLSFSKTGSPSDCVSKMEPKGANLSCEVCNRNDITSDAELTAHKKLHHAKSKIGPVSLQCAYCNEHCKSRGDLENHMKSHQVSCGKGKHKCNICDEIFSTNASLAEHKLSHCKIVAGNSCTQCKTMLVDEQSFYNHQLQHSNTSAMNKSGTQISLPANCIICCQTLQTDVEIKLHSKFHLRHLQQKEFVCIMCNKVCDFSSRSTENDKISICKECTMETTNDITYVPRLDQKKHFACVKCPKTFASEDDIKNHATEHIINDETNLECHLCRNILPSPTKLQIHLIEHNFMGIGQYRCYVCSSVFTTAAGLRSHIIDHGLTNRPYECSECKTKYLFETELENHRYAHMHSNHRSYAENGSEAQENQLIECKVCSSTFPESIYYTEHVDKCQTAVSDLCRNVKVEPNTNHAEFEVKIEKSE